MIEDCQHLFPVFVRRVLGNLGYLLAYLKELTMEKAF